MRILTLNLFLLAPLCAAFIPAHASETHWAYRGVHGPSHWGEFSNGLCATGNQQSPINVELKNVQPLKNNPSDLQVNYGVSALNLTNNGHTIQANVIDNVPMAFNGVEYRLMQLHFHTPSEHLINHRPYPMEMHLVNQDKDGRLLVLGIMIKEGENNKLFSLLWKSLPTKEGDQVTLDANTAPNLGMLIPLDSHHLYYKGSLTTPPCTEGVQWVLFEKPIELSKSQINRFRQIFSDNHRSAQSANGREVDED